MKKTPWFDAATQNPVHVGVYEVKAPHVGRYSKWDGKHWLFCTSWIDGADRETEQSGAMYGQKAKWRGLCKPS